MIDASQLAERTLACDTSARVVSRPRTHLLPTVAFFITSDRCVMSMLDDRCRSSRDHRELIAIVGWTCLSHNGGTAELAIVEVSN